MRKVIITIIVAIALIAAGGALCGVAYARMGGNFEMMSFADMEDAEMKVTQEFTDIEVAAITGNVTILRSEDGACFVNAYQDKKAPFEVSAENGKLQKKRDNVPWYESLSFLADMPKVVVSLPAEEYGKLTAKTDTGKITVEGKLSVESMSLVSDTGELTISQVDCKNEVNANTDTGNVEISDVTCGNLKVEGETTNVRLDQVTATGTFDITTDYGNVTFDECDASKITAEVDTGSITGTLKSSKSFDAKTDTGSVHVPEDTDGGRCKLRVDTGDIRVSISE